jgi:hypothetical protein
VFKIEDEWHAELQDGDFPSLVAAAIELRRLADIPWDQVPNVAPCTSWRTCGRKYELVEYDTSVDPWRQIRRVEVLEIDSKGIRWLAPDIAKLGIQ